MIIKGSDRVTRWGQGGGGLRLGTGEERPTEWHEARRRGPRDRRTKPLIARDPGLPGC